MTAKLQRLLDHLGVVPSVTGGAPSPALQLSRGIDALLESHGLATDVDDPVPPGVREAFRGSKIEAIKLYREATGVGLKEAKEAVEALAEREGW